MIGENIRMIRLNKNMTMKKLSEKCGLAISTICDIEKGRSNPSLESLERISKALNTDVGFLMSKNYVNNVNNRATGTE